MMDAEALYQAIDSTFYDDLLHSINPVRRWFHHNRYAIVNSLVKSFWEPGARIADLGSGSCTWNENRLPVTGVDYNAGLLSYGLDRGRLADYRVADIQHTGLPDESCEIVVASDVMEHLQRPQRLLAEICRILRPGGACVLSVPYDTPLSAWAPLFLMHRLYMGYVRDSAYYREGCGHLQHFSPASVRELLAGSGLQLELLFSWHRLSLFLVARKPGPQRPRPLTDLTLVLVRERAGADAGHTLRKLEARYPGARALVVSRDGGRRGTTAAILDALDRLQTPFAVVVAGPAPGDLGCLGRLYNQVRLNGTLSVAVRPRLHHPPPGGNGLAGRLVNMPLKAALHYYGKQVPREVTSGILGLAAGFCRRVVHRRRRHFTPHGNSFLFELLRLCDAGTDVETVFCSHATSLPLAPAQSLLSTFLINPVYRPSI
jgi:SAM-dependent methyltransferase